MGSPVIEINTESLGADTAAVRGEIQRLRRYADDLRGAVSALNRTWEGEAKRLFLQNYERELRRLEEAIDALERFTAQTELSGAEYEACERAVGAMVASLRL